MDRRIILEYNFKTEICNNWKKTGECPYKYCYFAHGNNELMKPGEYTKIQRHKKEAKRLIKKEKRKAKRASASESIKKDSDTLSDEYIYDENIYDRYWNSIHSLIINESVNVLSNVGA